MLCAPYMTIHVFTVFFGIVCVLGFGMDIKIDYHHRNQAYVCYAVC